MKRFKTLGIIFILLGIVLRANAASVLVVAGELSDAAGKRLEGQFTVRVKNETQNLEASNAADASGMYTVSFVAEPPEQATVAEAGDRLKISVLNAAGQLTASQTYQLKSNDIAAARAVVNIAVEDDVQPIPVLVVSGVVTDGQGRPVGAGTQVNVANLEGGQKASGVTNASGEYVVTLADVDDPLISIQVGETIAVTVGGTTAQKSLTADNIRDAHISVPIQVGGETVVVTSGNRELAAIPGASTTITVTVENSEGQPVTDAQVTPSLSPQVGSLTPVQNRGNGTYTFTYTAGTTLGNVTVSARTSQGSGSTVVTLISGPPAKLELTLSPPKLTADGTAMTTITAQITDVADHPLSGQAVTFSRSPNVGQLSAVKDGGDGSYTTTYTAGTTLGNIEISAKVDTLEKSGTLELIAGPPAKIEVTVEPSELAAGSGDTAKITTKVTDSANHPLSGQTVVLTLSPNVGQVSAIQDGGNGDYTATYTAGATEGTVTLIARVGSVEGRTQMTLVRVEFQLTVELPASVEAGQNASINLTLLSAGNPVSNRAVQLSVEGGGQTIQPTVSQTNAQGKTQATFRPTVAGTYTVRVNVQDLPERTETLTVTPGAAAKIALLDVPKRVERGDAVSFSIRVVDRFDNAILDADVRVESDLGGSTVETPAVNRERGVYTTTFRAENVGTATVEAQIPGGPATTTTIEVTDTRIQPPITGQFTPNVVKVGDRLTVTADAEAGGTMTFSISEIPSAQKLEMTETRAGHYEGSYTPPDEIEVSDAPVMLAITDAAGNLGDSTLSELVTIDTQPPPAPTNLQVEGGEITADNVASVNVTASATPNRPVSLTVTAVSNGDVLGRFPNSAGGNGLVRWRLDVTDWRDGDYQFTAQETADSAGNEGTTTSVSVRKDTRPPGPARIRSPRFSPSAPIAFNTTVQLTITVVFLQAPPREQVELEVTLRKPTDDEDELEFFLPLTPDPDDLTFQSGQLTFTADQPGVWGYTIVWPGDQNVRRVERSGEFEVTAAQGTLTLVSGVNFIKSGQPITFSGQLTPNLAEQTIQLQTIRPGAQAWEQLQLSQPITTSAAGRFEAQFTPDSDGVWQFRAVWGGSQDDEGRQLYRRTVSPTAEVTLRFPFGKVIIAVGGTPGEDYWRRTFFRLARRVYGVFREGRQFPAENIRFLSPTLTEEPTDTPISKDALDDAILNWGPEGLQPNENLFIYLLSDNLRDAGFILQRGVLGTNRLEVSDVQRWLEELNRRRVNVVFVMESCYSGEYIQPPSQPTQARRFLITSATARTQADIIRTDSFSRRFFGRLNRREDFRNAFEKTAREMDFAGFRNRPQLDADGDGVTNEQEDLTALNQFFLGDQRIQAGDEPEIFNSPSQTLAEGVQETTIEAIITGGGITATATIFPPGSRDTDVIGSWDELEGETIALAGDENTGYRGIYSNFTEPGVYNILINAENADGSAIPFRTTVTVPSTDDILTDINNDGVVNIFDLVAVAGQFGARGPNLSGDINGDGVVNIFDLVAVAGDFGKTRPIAAAPSPFAPLPPAQIPAIQQALAELEAQPHPTPDVRVATELLRGWLASQVTETRLLPNFPNPFNPETWIPYQLATDADVEITIYDLHGAIVRRLDLGHQRAGYYDSRQTAAYWDGRSDMGEKVSSGLYFYRISAGDFTSVRRMVVVK